MISLASYPKREAREIGPQAARWPGTGQPLALAREACHNQPPREKSNNLSPYSAWGDSEKCRPETRPVVSGQALWISGLLTRETPRSLLIPRGFPNLLSPCKRGGPIGPGARRSDCEGSYEGRRMFCRDRSVVKVEKGLITVAPLRCRCWSCEECRPDRTRRLVYEARSGKPTLFITLTSRKRPDRSPSWAAQELVKCWRLIRRRYIKAHRKTALPFLAVFEETKAGWPHLHIVARADWISQRWLSDQMAELHDSPIVDVRRVEGLRKVAAYVTKYIGKNPMRFDGVKRYYRSLDFLTPDQDEELRARPSAARWEAIDCPWPRMVAYLEDVGFVAAIGRHDATLRYGVPP